MRQKRARLGESCAYTHKTLDLDAEGFDLSRQRHLLLQAQPSCASSARLPAGYTPEHSRPAALT